MKKNSLLVAAMGMASLFCVSCADEYYVTEEKTFKVDPYTWSEVFTVTNNANDNDIYKKHWSWNAVDSFYYCWFEVPELTTYIFDKGVKQAFMYYELDVDGANVPTLSPLPFSDFYVVGGYRYEEHFTIDWQPGWIRFVLKIDDHDPSAESPFFDSYDFEVQFLW